MKPEKMAKDLRSIADASRRDNGKDIPLGTTLRNAAHLIEYIDAERECYEMMAHDLAGEAVVAHITRKWPGIAAAWEAYRK